MPRTADDGFTLMEALVALVLLALAAGAFYQGIELGMRGARIAERDLAALTFAENRLAEAVAVGPAPDVAWTGSSPDGISWATTFTEQNIEPAEGVREAVRLTRIDVRVTWRDAPARPARDLTLTTFAPLRSQP